MSQPAESAPWWEAFPEFKAACPRLEPSEVKDLLEAYSSSSESEPKKKTFLLVDVRRTDWEGGTVATSINLPAQTLYQTRPVIHQLCKQAGVETVIFYCGSSSGRGPRSAGWMQDYFDEIGETQIRAVILKGGIKGWQKTYGGELMDWYDAKVWSEEAK